MRIKEEGIHTTSPHWKGPSRSQSSECHTNITKKSIFPLYIPQVPGTACYEYYECIACPNADVTYT
jgi:hypothetical protein